jgi:hypothetical protein
MFRAPTTDAVRLFIEHHVGERNMREKRSVARLSDML